MARPSFVQARKAILLQSITASETGEIIISQLVDAYDNPLEMSDFGPNAICYLTLDAGGGREEIISFTNFERQVVDGNVSRHVIINTGIVRGLAGKGPYTATGTPQPHAAGASAIVSNNPQIYELMLLYMEGLAIAGAPDASTTQKGLVEQATLQEVIDGAEFGSTGAPLFVGPDVLADFLGSGTYFAYVVDTGSLANTHEIDTIGGPIAQYEDGQTFLFKASVNDLTDATLEVDGLAAVPIVGNRIAIDDIVLATYDDGVFKIKILGHTGGPTGMVSPFAGSVMPSGWLECDGDEVSRVDYARLFGAIGETYGAGDGINTFKLPDLRSRMVIGDGGATKVATFVSRSGNVITVSGLANILDNEFQTGQAVVFNTNGTNIGGLSNGTTYYLIRQGNNSFSLATSRANAIAGTAITLSSDGTGTRTFTLTLRSHTLGDYGGEEEHSLLVAEMPSHNHDGVWRFGSSAGAGGGSSNRDNSNTTNFTGGSEDHNNVPPFLALKWMIKT